MSKTWKSMIITVISEVWQFSRNRNVNLCPTLPQPRVGRSHAQELYQGFLKCFTIINIFNISAYPLRFYLSLAIAVFIHIFMITDHYAHLNPIWRAFWRCSLEFLTSPCVPLAQKWRRYNKREKYTHNIIMSNQGKWNIYLQMGSMGRMDSEVRQLEQIGEVTQAFFWTF